ncbi:MAG: zinc transporter ZupT [Nitrospirales bacterium]|nr:MAG: zinc transporter ZupT [Nitrospirales bacterium]
MDNVWQLIELGAVAGVFPIYLGIGLALLIAKGMNRSLEGYLTGIATGVLVYLFFDLMHEAVEQTGATDPLSWVAFLGSLLIGYVGLVLIEQRQQGRYRTEPAKLFLPYMIALGMGLHNLGEGLAIGAAYMQGEWVLGGLLIMGFALHNGTEGFAIIGSAGTSKPGLKDILLMGLLAGLPTCLGTVISGFAISYYFTIMFFALAAGSLLYVIFSLTTIFYTASRRVQCSWGVFTGISLMFLTAIILQMVTGIRS